MNGHRMFAVAFALIVILGVTRVIGAAPPDKQRKSADMRALRVMTFNIRYGTAKDGENAWPHRRTLVVDVLKSHEPHAIGLQESLRFQLDELREALPHLEEAGVGRDDGREAGEYAAILVDRRRLKISDQGTFWFAASPEKVGSLSWDAKLPRICTWVHCQDMLALRSFYLYNVHWDHQSQLSRENSADLLLKRIANRKTSDDPVIVTGDFNAAEDNPAYLRLVHDDDIQLVDSFRMINSKSTSVRTSHGFRGGTKGRKIDAVLVDPAWRVLDAHILHENKNSRFPSDHYPVTADLQLR